MDNGGTVITLFRIRRTGAARPPRRRHRLLGAAAVAALFACTACGPAGQEAAAGSTPSASPGAGGPAKPTVSASATPQKTGDGGTPSPTGQESGNDTGTSGGTAGQGSDSGQGDNGAGSDKGGKAPSCDVMDLTFKAVDDGGDPGDPPLSALLSVTNHGDRTCRVHAYPYVWPGPPSERSGTRQHVDADDQTKPKVAVTLSPGKSAYTILWGGDTPMDEYLTDTVTLQMQNASGTGVGQPAVVKLLDEMPFNNGASVNYWTTEMLLG